KYHPNVRLKVEAINVEAYGIENRSGKDRGDHEITEVQPPGSEYLICPFIENIRDGRQNNHQIDRAVLGGHHSEISNHGMLRASDRLRFLPRHEQSVRRKPD